LSAPDIWGLEAGGKKRCPECGVENKAGARRCAFCGRKIARDDAAFSPARKGGRATGLLWLIVVFGLLGGVVVFGKRLRGQLALPPPAPPQEMVDKRQAAAACEEHTRRGVKSPFRVIAFRSGLVAEEEGGFVVSGTVDLQSLAGELQRKRYWCRVRRDGQAGAVVGEGRLF